MAILPNSRYASSPVLTVTVNGQPRQVIGTSQQEPYTFNYTSYQITDGDRIDAIANAFYGDPTKWYAIADVNPEILSWDNLTAGQIIRIPNV